MAEKIRRYPSIRAFTKEEARLFIGRDDEKKLLYNKVVAEKVLLLFARSGIGKSSLVNAGLIPMLEERGFLPLEIRLSTSDDPSDTPLKIFRRLLSPYLDQHRYKEFESDIRKTAPNYKPGLWEYLKYCTFPLASTPVFIFDQFEQFFSFTIAEQDEFLNDFKDIIADTVPFQYIEWLNELTDQALKEKYALSILQPDVRVLFAIRSDKIFEINRLTQFIPNILRNRFELYPLNEENAKKAIRLPAKEKNSSLYQSPRFDYEEILLDKIISSLKGKSDVIETTQLQIICSEIEARIILSPFDTSIKPENYEVTENDLKKIGGIGKIISNFYQNQIKKTGNRDYQELAKILIEDNLFDKSAKGRKIVFEDAAINILKANAEKNVITEFDLKAFLAKLLDLRLIREDYRERKKFYEISHDYLLDPISESFDKREGKRLEAENKKLEESNKNLEQLKKDADDKAKQLDDKLRELEDSNRKRKWLSRIVAAITILGVIILIKYSSNLKGSKQEKEELNRKITTALVSIFNHEAEKRYAIGDRVVAYALWDSATKYSPDDTTLKNKLQNLFFPLFIGKSLQLSRNLRYAAVKYENLKLIVWEISNAGNEIKEILSVNDIAKFNMLPDGKVIFTDTSAIAYHFTPGENTGKQKLLPDSVKVSQIDVLEKSNLLLLKDRKTSYHFFYSIDSLKPVEFLNSKINRFIESIKEDQEVWGISFYDFKSIDADNLLITTLNQDYYRCTISNKKPPEKIKNLPADVMDDASANNGRLLAYIRGGTLKIFDLLKSKEMDTGIPLGENDTPLEFFSNDSLILVEYNKPGENDTYLSSFSVYNINTPGKKPLFNRSVCKNISYSRKMDLIAFTDTSDALILFDARQQKVIYPQANMPKEPKAVDYRIYEDYSKIYILRADNKMRILTVPGGGKIESSITDVDKPANDYKFPKSVYSDQFHMFYDTRTRIYTLKNKDSAKNNIQYLQQVFRKYIDKEIKKTIGE